jgi:hypothetical protein
MYKYVWYSLLQAPTEETLTESWAPVQPMWNRGSMQAGMSVVIWVLSDSPSCRMRGTAAIHHTMDVTHFGLSESRCRRHMWITTGENCSFFSTYNISDTKCVGFFHTKSQLSNSLDTKWYPSIQFNSDTAYWELVQTPQVKGSAPQDCHTLDVNTSPRPLEHRTQLAKDQWFQWPPPQFS